jgi:hypothetical protein
VLITRSRTAAAIPVLSVLLACVVATPGSAPNEARRTGPVLSPRGPTDAAAAGTRPTAGQLRVKVHADVALPGRGALSVPVRARVIARAKFATAGRRHAVLQRAAGGTWTTVTSARSGPRGTVTFRLPTAAAGRAAYRLLAVAAGPERTVSSRTIRIAVLPEGEAPAPVDLPAPVPRTVPPDADGSDGPVDAYSLLDTGRPGAVFRWNPCSPIRYRTRLDGAPPALAAAVVTAVQQLSAATGLTFVDLGRTDFTGVLAGGSPVDRPADADLLLTVAAEAEAPTLAGPPVGYAALTRSVWAGPDARIVRADIVLEKQFVTSALSGLGSPTGGVEALLLHELGHAVGLGHSLSDTQIMYPTLTDHPAPSYRSGDRSGLARVGVTAGCLT